MFILYFSKKKRHKEPEYINVHCTKIMKWMAWFCVALLCFQSEYECRCDSILLRLPTYTSCIFLLALAKLKLMNILLFHSRFLCCHVIHVRVCVESAYNRTFNNIYTGYAMSHSYSKYVKSLSKHTQNMWLCHWVWTPTAFYSVASS